MKNIACFLALWIVTIFSLTGAGWAAGTRLHASDLAKEDILRSDVGAEMEFGQDLAARILASHPLVEDPTTQYYINLVGSAVAMSAGRPEIELYFGVIESKEANAFAVPGGYIFITSAALDLMTNEAELAGVLGHEIGHIISRHMVKDLDIKARDGSAIAGLSTLIGGTTAGLRGVFDKALDDAVDILFHRGYKAADELEADQIGVILTAFSGYDPTGLRNFIQRVKNFEPPSKDHKGEHPLHKVRVDAINEALKTGGINPITYRKGNERFSEKQTD